MKPPRRRAWVPWAVFAIASLLVLEVLGWASWRVVSAERARREIEAEAEVEQRLRLALWRMDSYVVPLLARESVRPSRTASPYLGLRDEQAFYVRGTSADPADPVRLRAYVPPGTFPGPLPWRVLEPASAADVARVDRDAAIIAGVVASSAVFESANASFSDGTSAVAEVADAEEFNTRARAASRALNQTPEYLEPIQLALSDALPVLNETDGSGDLASDSPAATRVGVFRPVWLKTGDAEDRLTLIRGVETSDGVWAEVIWLDWGRLRGALLSEAAPLIPGLALEPRRGDEAIGAADLASIPVRAAAPRLEMAPGSIDQATLTALGATWAAVLAALGAIGVVLFVSRRVAEQRWRFAAAVTHELRTPLTGLRLNADLLKMAPDDAARAERTEAIGQDARRLSSVVESVLAFARVGSTGDPTRVSRLPSVIRTIVELAQASASQRGVNVEHSDIPSVCAPLDPDALERAIGNLVDNALRHAASRIRISGEVRPEGRGAVVVVVEDDGPGIPRADRRRVFRPFARGEGGGGAGLGTAIARELARAVGGDVRLVDSGTGGAALGGARFELSLPIAPDPIDSTDDCPSG